MDGPIAPLDANFIECKNRARWWFYQDKFVEGRQAICTTCLLAFLESHVSFAIFMRRPWLFRGRCRWSHEPDYAGLIRKKLEGEAEIGTMEPGVRVGFRSGGPRFAVVLAPLHEEDELGEFEIHTNIGLSRAETESRRRKAAWLAEAVRAAIAEMDPPIRLNSIRAGSESYLVCLTGESSVATLRFPRNLIDDMTDPPKPPPETRAKFSAAMQQQTSEAQRNLKLSR